MPIEDNFVLKALDSHFKCASTTADPGRVIDCSSAERTANDLQ